LHASKQAEKEANKREDVSDLIAEHNAKKRKLSSKPEQKAKRQKVRHEIAMLDIASAPWNRTDR